MNEEYMTRVNVRPGNLACVVYHRHRFGCSVEAGAQQISSSKWNGKTSGPWIREA